MVGLEQTFYNVSESVQTVEVCAIVYSPEIACPIGFPFIVSLVARDGTASRLNSTTSRQNSEKYCTSVHYKLVTLCIAVFLCAYSFPCYSSTVVFQGDHLGLSTSVLMFNDCESRSCADATIVDDTILEEVESFFVVLGGAPGLDTRISLNPVNGEIQINDDDCEFGKTL